MTGPLATEQDPRWQSVLDRDRMVDGRFVYAVRTTGIYCRPSCPSRRAQPQHVAFFETPDDAEAAGFRACRRCHPRGVSTAAANVVIIAEACRMIEQAEELPKLDVLAARMGVSPHHFHRLFRTVTGVTPHAWGAARRFERLREGLGRGDSVTRAIQSAGFASTSRVYETSHEVLGMTPTTWRDGGRGVRIRFALGACSLGAVLVAQSAVGICAITLGDDPEALLRDLQDRFPNADLIGGEAGFEDLVAQVVGFVDAPRIGFDLPLDIRGTAFQMRVWAALRQIPAGETVTYSQIADRIGAPKSVRAVAQACAANRIAVAIPCHRVVRTDGSLSGYRWGVERKRHLLTQEAES